MLRLVRNVRSGSQVAGREVLQSWRLSHVERVILDDGSRYIAKRCTYPLNDEGRIIRALHGSRIPMAELHVADAEGDLLTLLMEDLGPSMRQPTLEEAAAMANRVSRTYPPKGVPTVDQESLERMPQEIIIGIERLTSLGRWRDSGRILRHLQGIAEAAPELSRAAGTPPFGLCHREFHPTSFHIGAKKTALIDWQRTYTGPLLPCLANWFPTVGSPDLVACRSLIEAYVSAGGDREALGARGLLSAERWAFFWQRVAAVEWWITSEVNWLINDTRDEAWQRTVESVIVDAHGLIP